MPTPEQTSRFRSDLEALTAGFPERLGIAVSGGPDSLALLLLAHAALPGKVEAATVDHRLRRESADEARLVANVCADLGVPHATLVDPGAPISGANRQAEARELRYRLLAGWAEEHIIAFVATAHHMDDQAETVLMRLARGAGLAGLAAVRPRRSEGALTIVRPLLGWRHDELGAVVAAAGLAAVDDPSNRSEAYDRTRFRALLAENELLHVPRIAASAAHLADAEEALAWAAEREWVARAARQEGVVTLDVEGLPAELVRRLATRAIDTVRGNPNWRKDKLAGAIGQLMQGARITLAGVQISGSAPWRFVPEPPRRAV